MDFQSITVGVVAGLSALIGLYWAFRAGVKSVGEAIPGDDPFERFSDKLDKVDAIMVKIDAIVPGDSGGPTGSQS